MDHLGRKNIILSFRVGMHDSAVGVKSFEKITPNRASGFLFLVQLHGIHSVSDKVRVCKHSYRSI